VGRAVELNELAFSGRSQAALTMSGRPTFARRADAAGAEQTTQGFSAEREALCFNELFVEMMIVETGVARACQSEDAVGLRGCVDGWDDCG